MTGDKISTGSSYAVAAAITAGGGLTLNEWLMLGGFMLGVATFAVNWYYRHKTYRLMERKHDHPSI